jgi:ribosomal protein L40E
VSKTYYFICRRCNRRKRMEQQSIKPGICLRCYNRDADADEREAA